MKKFLLILMKIMIFTAFLFLSYAFAENGMATDPNGYKITIQALNQRLTKAEDLYKKQEYSQAKQEITNAYFQNFEGIEGAIRINYSQQEVLVVEQAFGEIRKLITQKVSVEEVANKINWLKNEITKVEKVIIEGHQIVAESTDDIYSNPKVDEYWKNAYKTIDTNLTQALSFFTHKEYAKAQASVKTALHEGYKNSELEIAIRTHGLVQNGVDIAKNFSNITNLINQPETLSHKIGYEITQILDTLSDILPGLAVPENVAKARAEALQLQVKDWNKVKNNLENDLNVALSLYENQQQKEDTITAIQDAYFDIFEQSGMEHAIGARNNNLKTEIEANFTKLQALVLANQDVSKIKHELQKLSINLESAVKLLDKSNQGFIANFLASLLIIVREGLEAILIVTAIATYLIKNNHSEKLHIVKNSVVVAIVLSLITALIFQIIFANAGASKEILEGMTMLIAVVLLFSMSYWLLSKVESKHWNQYIAGKLSKSLTTGSIIGLWLTSFFAVYREGAETVLFYYALSVNASTYHDYLALFSGFIVGIILIIAIYLIMKHSIVKLPLKLFFIFTGCFMYTMAFIFAGKGVMELIEGKLFTTTLITFVHIPEIPFLGIYPYVESLIPQIILIIAAIFAAYHIFNPKKLRN